MRILQRNEWYPLSTPVKRVIAGHRMDPGVFDALRVICEHKEVTLTRTGIGDGAIDADYVPPLGASAQRQRKRSRAAACAKAFRITSRVMR